MQSDDSGIGRGALGAWSDFAARFRNAVVRRRDRVGLSLESISLAIGKDRKTLRNWMQGVSEPKFRDIENLDAFFNELGEPGLLDELRFHRWQAGELSFIGVDIPSDMAQLAEGLLQTSEDPEVYLRDRGWSGRAHVIEVDPEGGVRLLHIGHDLPLRIGPVVANKDLRELSDGELGSLLHRQMVVIGAKGRVALHRIQSEAISYSRLAIPLRSEPRSRLSRIVSIPHDIQMSVDALAVD